MIIDFHSHVAFYKAYQPEFLSDLFKDSGFTRLDILSRLLKAYFNDKKGEKLISQMNEAGISKSILIMIDPGKSIYTEKFVLEECYYLYRKLLKKNRKRFVVFGSSHLDRGDDGFKLFKKSVINYGFKGLKLYPPFGYQINDERLEKYYKLCAEFELPVMIHCGGSNTNLFNSFAEPKHIFQVANKYPQINFVLAHQGFKLDSNADLVFGHHKNIYFDISGFQKKFQVVNQETIDALNMLFHPLINQRVLFGTDWPLHHIIQPLSKNVEFMKSLFEHVKEEYEPIYYENIMYRNAQRILGIE